jgi:hypothetical protein
MLMENHTEKRLLQKLEHRRDDKVKETAITGLRVEPRTGILLY